jgi:hypothetical protein
VQLSILLRYQVYNSERVNQSHQKVDRLWPSFPDRLTLCLTTVAI